MWRLSARNYAHFARYETPTAAGFRKYALLYRKTATAIARPRADDAHAAAYW